MMMTAEDFINKHRGYDVRQLALRPAPEGIHLTWCLQQIEGWQIARHKLPRWADVEQIWFPPKISIEQCSSEETALYKQHVCQRIIATLKSIEGMTDGRKQPDHTFCFADLTGGFGIDFSYLAPLFSKACYVERNAELCRIAQHNFPLLGISQAKVCQQEAETWLNDYAHVFDFPNKESDCGQAPPSQQWLIFLDPARRNDVGRKVFALEDCTPNVVALQHRLRQVARYIIIKLSPMLDIQQALRTLRGVREVHVVSLRGECKELMLVIEGQTDSAAQQEAKDTQTEVHKSQPIAYHCLNIGTTDEHFICSSLDLQKKATLAMGNLVGRWLCEPNASILKAGAQDALACTHGWEKLHGNSNLFLLPQTNTHVLSDATTLRETTKDKTAIYQDTPKGFGRYFRIDRVCDFSKRGIKEMQEWVISVNTSIKVDRRKVQKKAVGVRANLTVRNFPGTVDELRKRFHLSDGGDAYIFATTLSDERHVLLCCRK